MFGTETVPETAVLAYWLIARGDYGVVVVALVLVA